MLRISWNQQSEYQLETLLTFETTIKNRMARNLSCKQQELLVCITIPIHNPSQSGVIWLYLQRMWRFKTGSQTLHICHLSKFFNSKNCQFIAIHSRCLGGSWQICSPVDTVMDVSTNAVMAERPSTLLPHRGILLSEREDEASKKIIIISLARGKKNCRPRHVIAYSEIS